MNEKVSPITTPRKKYVVYGTSPDSYVSQLGRYDDLSDIVIRVSLFNPGTVIIIEEDNV